MTGKKHAASVIVGARASTLEPTMGLRLEHAMGLRWTGASDAEQYLRAHRLLDQIKEHGLVLRPRDFPDGRRCWALEPRQEPANVEQSEPPPPEERPRPRVRPRVNPPK